MTDTPKPTAEVKRAVEKSQTGLYQKFIVRRVDGRDVLGEKHHGCDYFVLDLVHDKYARPAVLAYAEACELRYPALARDLRRRAGLDD